MDVNQKYCQSCHLISHNELTDMLLMYGQCYQNAAAVSREYTEAFPERHHPGPRQLFSGEIDRTELKFL
jgi:hypothetical protein